MKALITTGPTQEPIDDVRYITNASSGKMGAALALEAMSRGHEVTLVHGPVQISLPECNKVAVKTTAEMIDAVMAELKKGNYDILISAAAIGDYSTDKSPGKIKSGQDISLKLKPTPKLIGEARKKHPELFIVAFKAEYGMRKDELRSKVLEFAAKNDLNLVVANDIQKNEFGSDQTELFLVHGDVFRSLGMKSKRELAGSLWSEIELHTSNSCLPD
jgi:phosphopantothenoylcysteine decarboxylase/phosphopantothenate--cysteine ligase